MQIGGINAKNDAKGRSRAYNKRPRSGEEISSRTLGRDLETLIERYNFLYEKKSVKNDWLTCRTKNCKYTGPVLHFAFIYGTTLCPRCATKMVWIKGNQTSYSGRK